MGENPPPTAVARPPRLDAVQVPHRAPAAADPKPAVARPRLDSVDTLRGLVMVIMALDHVRDFFGDISINAVDPEKTNVPLFFTRWVSHFCAPTFVFLTGVGTYLYGSRGRSRGEVSWYLLSRGLWIVVVEIAILGPLWRGGHIFTTDPERGQQFMIFGQVFWAIGASMVTLSALVWLPRGAILAFALALIFGHNALDGIDPDRFGAGAPVWNILHVQGFLRFTDHFTMFAAYPLIPWVGVLAAGYCFGPVLRMETAARRTWILGLGAALTLGFFVLRATNLYGDLFPWGLQRDETFTVLSFLNCHKYPPSLCYLMMTLGPALLLLAAFEWHWWPVGPILAVYGRVPMFYYLLHLPLILILSYVAGQIAVAQGYFPSLEAIRPPLGKGLGYGLPAVYATWMLVVALLYPPCLWYSRVKRRSNSVWLTYL